MLPNETQIPESDKFQKSRSSEIIDTINAFNTNVFRKKKKKKKKKKKFKKKKKKKKKKKLNFPTLNIKYFSDLKKIDEIWRKILEKALNIEKSCR